MKIQKTLMITAATALIASPALAHEGEHTASFAVNALHWLSSPSHALLATAATLGSLFLLRAIIAKRKA